MGWWRKHWVDGREPAASAIAKADALYQRAIQLSHQPGSGDAAERAAGEAAAAYRTFQRPTQQVLRKLAQALGLHAMLLAVNHGAYEALEPGREGITLARALLDAADPDDPTFDELIGEAADAMSDLSHIALASGRHDEHAALLREAVALCTAHHGPHARHALGTALHHQAAAATNAVQADVAHSRHDTTQAASVLDALDHVVAVRRELADPARPVTRWELADSLLLRGKLRCLLADGDGGAADLLAAWTTLAPVGGPSADTLRDHLRQAMHLAEDVYPDVVATLDWPWQVAPGDGDAPHWRPAMAEALRLMERGERVQAVAVLTPVAQSGAHEAMHTLALLYGEMGQQAQANEWFARAADAGNVKAMVIIGCQAAEAGQLRDAERWFRAGAELGHAQAMFNLAMVLSATGRTDEAAHWHRQSLAATHA